MGSRIQSYVVKTPKHTVVIDTGVGDDKERHEVPAWNKKKGTYLDDLRAAGVTPEEVDFVLCTHLHVDHVGWNTRLVGGKWVPTFPKAKYVMVGSEFEFWKREHQEGRDASGCFTDSVAPIMEAGKAVLVDRPSRWTSISASSPRTATRRATPACGSARRRARPCSRAISCTAWCRWRSPNGRASSAPTCGAAHPGGGGQIMSRRRRPFPRPGYHIVKDGARFAPARRPEMAAA
jgi:hypothetical protein